MLIMMQGSDSTVVREKAVRIKQKLESSLLVTVFGGVSTQLEHISDMSRCYHDAMIACETAAQTQSNELIFYDNFSVDFLLKNIPRKIRQDFSDRIFAGFRNKELKKWLRTLQVFFKYNGSINETANQLFMHKNTLQYRINKIAEVTGYNPRITKEGFVLYLALLLKGEELE